MSLLSRSASSLLRLKSSGLLRASGAVRCMAELGIPSDLEQATGRRRLEIEAEMKGMKYFNNEPIIPTHDEGTFEKPIMVPSSLEWRAVGFEDPASHQLNWFRLTGDKIHYIPAIGLYFKMEVVH